MKIPRGLTMRLSQGSIQRLWISVLASLTVISLLVAQFPFTGTAQTQDQSQPATTSLPGIFKLERTEVQGGAELITIHARLDGISDSEERKWVPMVTVLRDTLGDLTPENDRLRYVWPLTYTHPTMRQRLSAAVPFLYARVGNKKSSHKAPPPVLDLAAPDRDLWNKLIWGALQSLLLDTYGMPLKASSRSYRQNISDYRKSHVIRALSVLSLYQAVEGTDPAFSESELAEIQSRLQLTDKTFGGIVDSLQLGHYYQKRSTETEDVLGHNWELLRQRAEAESLLFEPLVMPDGRATHALLWVARADLAARRGQQRQPYEKRFLNIANPWSDKRLIDWKGYVETRYFDTENRPVSPETLDARPVEMIPLALYGLDHPKIPVLLVDFRDGLNPKKREMSRRALQDVTQNVLSVSGFGSVPYFLGRNIFDFVTGRRGMDVNQPSRLRTYAQLKLLLSLDKSLTPELREEVTERLEKVSLNPLENDLVIEAELARQQHAALLRYASTPSGLPARLDRDRRAELVPLEHGKVERVIFRLGNILSFGKYTHREKPAPEVEARLNVARRLNYHTRFLREVAQSSPRIDVVWNLDDVKRSLRYVGEQGSEANARAVRATAQIFDRTEDDETRRICLDSLARINNSKARKELIRIAGNKGLSQTWKDLIAAYLNNTKPSEPLAASGLWPVDNQTER
ncbi:MAG TPA: hypothetical protein VGW36_03410 [Pyrinomonadaceae bacterium]|nr:hypothetical protein [Pyrinomonadaceae bacterium]